MDSERLSPTRTVVAAQLAILFVATAILIPAVTPGEAVTGGLWVKLAFLARVAVLVTLATWMLRRRSLGWSDMGLKRPEWRRFLIALPAGLLIVFLFSKVTAVLLPHVGLKPPDHSMFAPIKGNLGQYLFLLLPVTVGTAAFGEELLFRGFITDALSRLFNRPGIISSIIAITAQALIFGGLHFYQGLGGVVVTGVIGLGLGLTWLISGRNLWAGIIIHALLDGAGMTAIYLGYVTA